MKRSRPPTFDVSQFFPNKRQKTDQGFKCPYLSQVTKYLLDFD